jgi:molybdenum cofactor cytidylyltransferase
MQTIRRIWAVIPAAGFGRRMGQPKLLLELQGRTVIARLVESLRAAGCESIWVLAREDDPALLTALSALPVQAVVTAIPTPDMRASVQVLLRAIEDAAAPRLEDAWLLCPADHPIMNPAIIRSVLQAGQRRAEAVVIPVHAGRRGHPTLFPWRLAARAVDIPADAGLNWLLRQPGVVVEELPVAEDSILRDLDTPADYERLQSDFAAEEGIADG